MTHLRDDQVSRIDPVTGNASTARVGQKPMGIAAGGGAVWVADSSGGSVSKLDPRSRHVIATLPVGGSPEAVAFDPHGVWVNSPPTLTGSPIWMLFPAETTIFGPARRCRRKAP